MKRLLIKYPISSRLLVVSVGLHLIVVFTSCTQPVHSLRKLAVVGSPSTSTTPTISVLPSRFQDTLTISLGKVPEDRPLILQKHNELIDVTEILDSAALWCIQGRYDRLRYALISIIESVDEADSLHWEAIFQLGECYAVRGEFEKCARLLGEIAYRSTGVPHDVHQRSLVRLGHIFCIMGQIEQANELFKRLWNSYPTSPYRAIANCEVIR